MRKPILARTYLEAPPVAELSLTEIVCLAERDWTDLGFVGREGTPKPPMEIGIRLH